MDINTYNSLNLKKSSKRIKKLASIELTLVASIAFLALVLLQQYN